MRKYTRNQVKDLMATIQSGLKYITAAPAEEAISTLANCYAIAQLAEKQLLDDLDSIRAVHYRRLTQGLMLALEAAVESAPHRATLREEIRLARKQATLLAEELDAEQNILTEILFLPVFAEQWPFMDSVWQAAKRDPRCECEVVPIPYYQRAREGHIGRKIYEGNLFPEHLKIMHFEKYDISRRNPDIIYIQNADDDGNDEIAVPGIYFTEELKKHARRLVYLPAGLSSEPYSAPGLSRVDAVIAKTEPESKIYSKLGVRRVMALGAPVVDKALAFRDGENALPPQWVPLLENRTVILLRTQTEALTVYGMDYIEKLEKIIRMFESREDVAVIWRPQKLSAETLETTAPRILREYRMLLDAYQKSGIGVYDDSADFLPAFAAADAFLGDHSDEMFLLGLLGKPLMQQSVDIYTAKPQEITPENAYSYESDDILDYIFQESPAMGIPDFLDYAVSCGGKPNPKQTEAYKKLLLHADGNCGEAVHNAVMLL